MAPCMLVFAFAFLVVVIWVDFAAWRAMKGSRSSRLVFTVLALGGLVLGGWCSGLEYQVSSTVRLHSFPLPAALFHLEGGQWVDFVSPMTPLLAFYDLILIAALLPFLWALRTVIKTRRASRRSLQGRCPACGYDLTGNTSGLCPECGKSSTTDYTDKHR